jgi:hypothetical protein
MGHSLAQLEKLVSQSQKHLDKAEAYLKTRKLNLFKGVGYVDLFVDGDFIVSDSLIIASTTPKGVLTLVEARKLSTGVYSKFTRDDLEHIPAHNLHSIQDTRIITEAVLDAESIEQHTGYETSSTLRASQGARNFHLIAACTRKHVVYALDNDGAGQQTTRSASMFFAENYPELTFDVLDYPTNDINNFLTKKGANVFRRRIKSQLDLITGQS